MMNLIVTPAPRARESFWGYILRLNEANGYESPYGTLKSAGIPQEKMFKSFPRLDYIAQHLAIDAELLRPVVPEALADIKAPIPVLLGKTLLARQLRTQSPAFCAQCVKEAGHLQVHWELQYVTCCPKHQCELLRKCPVCNDEVTWFRQGLLKCRCGADWSTLAPVPAPPEAAALMQAVIDGLYGEASAKPTAGLPPELWTMELRTLLSLISRLGGRPATWRHTENPFELIPAAAKILSNWPYNFQEHLIHLEATNPGHIRTLHYGLCRCTLQREQVAFVEDQFRIFGLERWGDNWRYRIMKLRSKDRPSRKASKNFLRDRFDRPSKTTAAGLIQIPAPVLGYLRENGYFPRSHQLAYDRFDREEVLAFASDIVARCGPPDDMRRTVSLADVLAWRPMKLERRAEILLGLRNGTIRAFANPTESLIKVRLDADDAHAFWQMAAIELKGGLSRQQAADRLHCDTHVLDALTDTGYLEWLSPARRVVKLPSVIRFEAEFKAVVSFAKARKQSVHALCRMLEREGAQLLWAERTSQGACQPFLHRDDWKLVDRAPLPKPRRRRSLEDASA